MLTRTALILPLDPPNSSVEAFRLSNDPVASQGVPAHFTLIFPFIALEHFTSDNEHRLWRLIRHTSAFSYSLAKVSGFPDAATYLAPDRPEPFVSLISRLTAAFPDHPPYEGAFADIIPHLTVGDGTCGISAEREIPLPILAVANHAILLRESRAGWKVFQHFRFSDLDPR